MYHTAEQIFVGSSLGVAIGILYYMATERWPRTLPASSQLGRFRAFLYTNPVSRALRLRDSWSVWSDGSEEHTYDRFLDSISAAADPTARAPAFQGSNNAHLKMMLAALQEADHCEAVTTAFSVGCVIAAASASLEQPTEPLAGVDVLEPHALFTGFSRELPGNTHAEECALEKLVRYCGRTPEMRSSQAVAQAAGNAPLELIMYTTMEPCSERLSGNAPCVDRILRFNDKPPVTTAAWLAKAAQAALPGHGTSSLEHADRTLRPLRIQLVVQGVREPEDFVQCQGQRKLRDADIHVTSAAPKGAPGALGLSVPNLSSVSLRVRSGSATEWLEDVCLRMAKKGHESS